MSDEPREDSNENPPLMEQPPPLEFKVFLESVHPSTERDVTGLWEIAYYPSGGVFRKLTYPELRLHCKICEGERTFRTSTSGSLERSTAKTVPHPIYICGDCNRQTKQYSLHLTLDDEGKGKAYKFGELPAFGIPASNKVLRLFRQDAPLFLKGRQCESLGYGIAAFAYYRRVVESHKNDLFNDIIKVCKTIGAPAELIDELESAKLEISFSKSLDKIKVALPQGLLINGHNPLAALHSALSVGLHNETDDFCLEAAAAVRLVLNDLVDKIATLKQDDAALNKAVHFLIARK